MSVLILGKCTQTVLVNEQPYSGRFAVPMWVLGFGAYGDTRLAVYAESLDAALNECVDYIAENLPGILADEQVQEAYREALAELVAEGADPDDEEAIQWAQEQAEEDTTIAGNESHYLLSWEWGVILDGERSTRATRKAVLSE